MQYNDDAGEFALLTRQEVAYLSDGLPHLTDAQKSKLNYKIKKKLQIFEKVELPLLMKSGFELGSISLSVENNKDCHSLVFFFNDRATTEIYTLSLHDALPISSASTIAGPKASGWGSRSPEASSKRWRSEEHTSELQSPDHLVCRLLLEKK